MEYSPSEVVSCILEELLDKVLFGGATDFSDMYIKEEPLEVSEDMDDAGFDTQEYRQDVKIEMNSDDSDDESCEGDDDLPGNSSKIFYLFIVWSGGRGGGEGTILNQNEF